MMVQCRILEAQQDEHRRGYSDGLKTIAINHIKVGYFKKRATIVYDCGRLDARYKQIL
jgi:hypothetical protein